VSRGRNSAESGVAVAAGTLIRDTVLVVVAATGVAEVAASCAAWMLSLCGSAAQ